MAQITGFNQRGIATQELRAVGFAVAHPSLPLNSSVMVANILTGKEVEATVVGQIQASPNHIADLSIGVWQELELYIGAEIRIYTRLPVRPRPAVEPIVESIIEPAAEPVVAAGTKAETVPEPFIVLFQDIADPVVLERLAALEDWVELHDFDPDFIERLWALVHEEAPPRPDPEIMARLEALEARPEIPEVQEPVNVQPAAPVVLHVHPQVTQYVPFFVATPQVIPGLPDPNSGRIYRLQVGAFSSQQTADRISHLVSSVGFNVIQEKSGVMYRVLATDVPALMVSSAVQRLGIIGIEQVWVRE
jgi:hypothetical protein